MYTNEQINYTAYMLDKQQEDRPWKLRKMKTALVNALKARDVHGHISATYYQDGCIRVSVDGEYYNMFDSVNGVFFNGYVGD